ncbi:Nlrc3, partial [Symbiodinium sp. CCMP2456]
MAANWDDAPWSWNDDTGVWEQKVDGWTRVWGGEWRRRASPKAKAKAKGSAKRRPGSNRGPSQNTREAERHRADHNLLRQCQENLRRMEESLQLSQGEVWTLELQRDQLQESLSGTEGRSARLLRDIAKVMREKSDLEAQLKQSLDAHQKAKDMHSKALQDQEKRWKAEVSRLEKERVRDEEAVRGLKRDHENFKLVMERKLNKATSELTEERAEK